LNTLKLSKNCFKTTKWCKILYFNNNQNKQKSHQLKKEKEILLKMTCQIHLLLVNTALGILSETDW